MQEDKLNLKKGLAYSIKNYFLFLGNSRDWIFDIILTFDTFIMYKKHVQKD